MSEIAENKPTLMSRGLGALAAAQTYFPGRAGELDHRRRRHLPVRALRRAGDAVRAAARHGLLFSLAGRAVRRRHRIRLQTRPARRRRVARRADHDFRDHEARADAGDHGDRRGHAHHPVRRGRRARGRLEPAVRNPDGGSGGDLRRFRGAGDLLGAAQRRKPRTRHGVHGDRRDRAEHDRDDRLSADHRLFPSRSRGDRCLPRRHHPRRRAGRWRRLQRFGGDRQRRHLHQAFACGDAAARRGDAVVSVPCPQHHQGRPPVARLPCRLCAPGGGQQPGRHSGAGARRCSRASRAGAW